jgi:hypothetical protein
MVNLMGAAAGQQLSRGTLRIDAANRFRERLAKVST